MERAFRVISPIGLLVLWELAVRAGLLDDRFFPAPASIVASFVDFAASGELLTNLAMTAQRILIGFLLGSIPGLLVGLLVGINRWARIVIEPIVDVLFPVPKIAVLPLVLIIFGIGETSKYAIIAIGVFFPMLINVAAGVRQIDPILLDAAKIYRVSRLSLFARVLLPGALSNVFAGVRVSLGTAVILAVAAEFTAAKTGLGFVIWNAWQTLQIERMYVGLVLVALLGYLLSQLVSELERLSTPWRPLRHR